MRMLLLFAVFASVATHARADVEHIEPDAKANRSAAVVVADSVPLVHTRQVLAQADAKTAVGQLDAILKQAGSSLHRIVKLNFVIRDLELRTMLLKEVAQETFGDGKPAVSFVQGKLPGDAKWAVDAVALGTRREAWKQVEHGDGYALLPPGTRVYVSGQAVGAKSLAVATRKTLEELRDTLKFLGLKESAVVQLKAFVQPMAQHTIVAEETARFFESAKLKTPPLVLVEWQSTLPIEIELIAWGGRERAGEPIEYLTPPFMKASPVYSRVARVNDGKLIYLSSLHGTSKNDPAAEIPEMFDRMGKILAAAGSDVRHLAKATYYVTGPEATTKMREIRPRYYDPKRPPAASLAQAAGVGLAERTVTMDLIAVPSPRLRVNEYGKAEMGHGLSETLMRAGFLSLFDGKSSLGWSEGKVQGDLLLAGTSNLAPRAGQLILDVATPGTLRWNGERKIGKAGVTAIEFRGDGEPLLALRSGLSLRSILFKPELDRFADITPRAIGEAWKPIHHLKLPEDRRASWTIKDGVLTAVGGPGCLEYAKPFADFVLQLEVRTKLRHANGGVFFRSIPGSFMNGYEAQIYNRCHDGDPSRPWTWATGAIDDRQNARRLVSRDGEWFHYTILANGDRIATFINGYQTTDWQDTRPEHENPRLGKRTQAGTLQLQAHDVGTEVEFRNLRIAEWK